MAKATKVSDGSGAVAAASEFIEDSIQKFGKHHDTLKAHMVAQAEENREITAELEKTRADWTSKYDSMKSTLERERDEWKNKWTAQEDKNRRAAAALAS